ncbi:alcohol dehydrogenase catalytic domain-containing protein [Butyricicoccus faecihominis]|uniref:zinc-dependent alcohol dehydrogenase n=1 Tax=Butyricicoccus faecihominis TaxID=1712515 RepID=UPI00247AEEE2|nr:alcohol dehydrogenase catalytic domain-containing protein [Butyricicoccus faecihominis]MCQ5130138.1 alcohol dehydrogenase catalytic domain-containing protein [Butyricicoccus faecihominis]
MGETMTALRYLERGKLALQEIPVPVCGEDDILVEVRAAGICGADLHWENGAFNADHPFVLGHEFCGVICQLGSRVSGRWKIGDRVVSDNTGYACGQCSACLRGDFVHCLHRKTLGSGMDGGFTKYCRIPGDILKLYPSCLMKLPDCVSFEQGAIMEPAANAYRAMIQEAQVRPGDTVVIVGLGPLGLYSLQMAKLAGASSIICIGMKSDVEKRFPLAHQFGATHLLVADEEDIPARVRQLAGEDGVGIVVDAAGAPAVMHQAMEYLQHDGKFVRIGNPPGAYGYSLLPLIDKQITVIGHMGYNGTSWAKVMRLLETKQLDLQSLIGAVLPLSEYKTGYQMMRSQQVAKAVLLPE